MLTVIILSILLAISLALVVTISFIARAQYTRAQKYERMIIGFGNDVLETYQTMKSIDDRHLFEKDDDVGVVFQQLVDVIGKFNEQTQSRTEE